MANLLSFVRRSGLIALSIALGFLSEAVFAEQTDAMRFDAPSGKPAMVSVFQEVPAFWATLRELDKSTSYVDASGGWNSILDSDVWVFFLKDNRDLGMIPPIARQVLESNDGRGVIEAFGTVFEIEGKRFNRLLVFSFIDKFDYENLEIVGCETAAVVFHELDQRREFDLQKYALTCQNVDQAN